MNYVRTHEEGKGARHNFLATVNKKVNEIFFSGEMMNWCACRKCDHLSVRSPLVTLSSDCFVHPLSMQKMGNLY